MADNKAGRKPLSSVYRLALFPLIVVGLLETCYQADQGGLFLRGPMKNVVAAVTGPAVRRYAPIRAWAIAHPLLAGSTALAGLAVLIVVLRQALLLWHNQLVARIAGTYFRRTDLTFPTRRYTGLAEIKARAARMTFAGLKASRPRGLASLRRLGRWRWTPLFLTEEHRDSHVHVIGKTGSGKTNGVLWPQLLQDVLAGKGAVFMSGKGSDEEISIIKAIVAAAGRQADLRVFSLPAWNQPTIFTHSYNMVYVEPRTPESLGGDPLVTAERVFSVLPLGNNEYYNTQAQIFFGNLCRLLHGIVDENGLGYVFTMRDIGVCLRGVGDNGPWSRALVWCLHQSKDRGAAKEIASQIARLGRDIHKALSGLVGVVDKFQGAQVNAYDPDIVMQDVLEKNLILYVQLPSNLFKLQAPALGKVFLIDVQQNGALRQIHRTTRNQTPFAVTVDEFARFADKSVVDSLNQLRDAHIQFTLSHQSVADLEIVSREFAMAVWDNTRAKHILKQDNPALCELVSKSIGTKQEVLKTVRMEEGPLFTSLSTREASSRQVESYRLHPNAIKSLARYGQGYLVNDGDIIPVAYPMLPADFRASYPLTKKDQNQARGLRLYEQFIDDGSAASLAAEVEGDAPPPDLTIGEET